MLTPTVKRGLMLNFIGDDIICPAQINKNRVFQLNNNEIEKGDIVYVMSRELRIEDNWGLIYAQQTAKFYKRKLKIIININFKNYSNRQLEFIKCKLQFLTDNLAKNKLEYKFSSKIPTKIGAVVFDFNPLNLQGGFAQDIDFAAFEVDAHNIIPARFISDKQEFAAANLRRKVYANITDFLTEFPPVFKVSKNEAREKLADFIQNKLNNYADLKNDPNENMVSGLSPYLHFGLISSQRIALEVLKSKSSRENKEAFLEELIVRKELSDNFCLYNSNYKSLNGIPDWAKASLEAHRNDIRTYLYDISEFEYAKTHDNLWNAVQISLVKTGKIHGYLRMYWAKKILEWSKSPEEALRIAIYLNDVYALDGNDPNGYAGILWSIGGLHDRAFTNRLVTGKIRYMSLSGCKSKFNVNDYIDAQRGLD